MRTQPDTLYESMQPMRKRKGIRAPWAQSREEGAGEESLQGHSSQNKRQWTPKRAMKAPIALKVNSGSHAAKESKCLLSGTFI